MTPLSFRRRAKGGVHLVDVVVFLALVAGSATLPALPADARPPGGRPAA